MLTNEIEAVEVLTRKGRENIKAFYKANDHLINSSPTAPLTSLIGDSERQIEDCLKQGTQSSTTAHSRKRSLGRSSGKDPSNLKVDKCNLFNSYQNAVERFDEFDENGNFPDEIYTAVYHRRFIKKTYYFFTPFQPQLFSSPIIFQMPLKPTGKRVYEEVWAVA